jgi:hypothetical protein
VSEAVGKFADALQKRLVALTSVKPSLDGVLVTTHCMYPSNGLVRVLVRGGPNTFVVSDEGGAIDEAMSAGISITQSDGSLGRLVKDQGLLFKNAVIFSPQITVECVPAAVMLVANASKELAQWFFDHSKLRRTQDFRERLATFLERTFSDRVSHDATIIGASNKPHKFANVVSLRDGRRLIVDPVIRDVSSINSRVVANLDVKATNNQTLVQRIIYDDDDQWSASDLNLLQIGAPLIQFSQSSKVIQALAA